MNKEYFDLLLKKMDESKKVMAMYCPKKCPGGEFKSFSLLDKSDLREHPIFHFEDLEEIKHDTLKSKRLRLVKMQAGLGSSVTRDDVLKKHTSRSELGAKGTDLFFPWGDKEEFLSVASLQIKQAANLKETSGFAEVKIQFLVNEETKKYVTECVESTDNELKEIVDVFIEQKKMPTLNQSGELTKERLAPAGHGFIGYAEIYRAITSNDDEIICIGNGEDLNSTPDLKVVSHMIEENIPVVMITTTKTAEDLKGGQMGIVKENQRNHLSIFEKAQAEESDQLKYFEELGLREGDQESYFNTNMAIINSKALRLAFEKLNLSPAEFMENIAPEVIKNQKTQNGKVFTQLESALGSVLLNMGAFFNRNELSDALYLCNVGPVNRDKFFLPIKTRSDYDRYLKEYKVRLPDFVLRRR